MATATLFLGGVGVASRLSDGSQRLLEGFALGAVFSAPAILVILSLKARVVLLLAAAAMSGALSVFLATAMPFLALPALAYALAYTKQPAPSLVVSVGVVVAVPLVLDLAGALAIFLSTEEVCTTSGTATVCRETTTSGASMAALSLAVAAVVLAWFLARPAPFGPRVEEPHDHEQTT